MNLGTRIGPYEITAAIGAGGMGEVYRARDTQLNRDVALKVLPEALAADAERMARFEQEARALASLNHPNIAQVYGLERGDTTVIVMELVQGEDLAARLERGALPIDEVLPIARQVAEAMEAAHEAGIVHRDLKPANVRIRRDGTVKVLDFGLAKSTEGAGAASGNATQSPTMLSPAVTGVGVIMGTAAYMAPEQARGRQLDRRADVWAFGCVLFEMLSGKRAFAGDDVSMTLASVLKRDIDWQALPAGTPPPLRRMIERCLQVDPRRRYQSIGDARVQIEDWIAEGFASAGREKATAGGGPRPAVLAAAALALVVLTASVTWLARPAPRAPLRIVPLELDASTEDYGGGDNALLSPDGSAVLFRRGGGLWMRRLDEPEPQLLAPEALAMAFSPDGLEVAYANNVETIVRSLRTGGQRRLYTTPMPLVPYGLHWTAAGRLLESRGGSFGLAETDPATGTTTQLLAVEGETTRFLTPWKLPDGRVMFSLLGRGSIEVFDGSERHVLYDVSAATVEGALYVPTGHLVWSQWGAGEGVWAAPVSLDDLSFTGDAVRVWQHPGSVDVAGELMIVVPHQARSFADASVVLVAPDGTAIRELLPPRPSVRRAQLSPDGRRMGVVAQSTRTGDARVFLYDLESGASIELAAAVTRGNVEYFDWLPDSSHIVYPTPDHTLVIEDVTGSTPPQTLVAEGVATTQVSVSTDGTTILYGGTDGDIWYVDPGGGEPVRFRQTDDVEDMPVLSPDGRHIVYNRASTAGASGLLLERFPDGGDVQVVENEAWDSQMWSPDGTAIYYESRRGVRAVGFDRDTGRLTSRREQLFGGLPILAGFDATADGNFIVPRLIDAEGADGELDPAVLIENWQKLLER